MASTYLERTPASTGNQSTYTFSAWIKRSGISSNNQLFGAGYGNNARETYFLLDSNDKLNIFSGNYTTGSSTTTSMQLITDRVFRDTSAFYHIVIEVDTTQATASDRVKLYVNGFQETSFGTETYPSQNDTHFVNVTTTENQVGALNGGNTHDGSMAHVHFIDGTAYDADTFGETDATTGIWKPKTAPSVTYGTNGFFLKFENSGAFGTDSSGNANNFTVNGTMTQTIDTPSNVFATMNPLYKWDNVMVYSNGNTSLTGNGASWSGASSTLGISSGKWYYEAKFTSATYIDSWYIGFGGLDDFNLSAPYRNGIFFVNSAGGEIDVGDTGTVERTTNDYGTFANGDIMGVALDYDNETISIYKNGSIIVDNFDYGATTYSSTVKGGKTIAPCIAHYGDGALSFNFGNGYFGTTKITSPYNDSNGIGLFNYEPPTNFLSLCTKSLNEQEYD